MNEVLKKLLFEVVVPEVARRLISALPFLGLPVVNPILGMLLGWVAGEVFEVLSTFVDFRKIDLKNNEANERYKEAVRQLQDAQESPHLSEEGKKLARETFKNRFRELIRFDAD